MTNRSSVTVVGAGAWGTAVAHLLSQNCETVYLWASRKSIVEEVALTRCNETYLPGIRLRPNVIASDDLACGMLHSEIFVWAIPVEFLRLRVRAFAPYLPNAPIVVNLGKGIEERSWARPSEILLQECRSVRAVGSLVGPNIASEVAAGLYTEAILALSDEECLGDVAACFSTPSFRVHGTIDFIGIEIGAALKNVCSVAAGLCDGLGMGGNTKSLVIAASIAEIGRLGEALGADPRTLVSNCVVADLLTSCYSVSGRNRRVGEYLSQGHSLPQATALLGGRVAEGIATCRACYGLGTELGLRLPVVESLYALIIGAIDPRSCVRAITAGETSRPAALDGKAWAGLHNATALKYQSSDSGGE